MIKFQVDRCYVCGRVMGPDLRHGVFLEDDSHATVSVGSDCYRKVIKAGYDGVRSGKGRGPMVFIERHMAEAYARRESQA